MRDGDVCSHSLCRRETFQSADAACRSSPEWEAEHPAEAPASCCDGHTPDNRTVSGRPCRSVTMWHFVPNLPQSVGFGPVVPPPPFLPQWTRCPYRPGSIAVDPPSAGGSVKPDEASPKLQQSANPATAASMSLRNQIPSRAEASPMECRLGERTVSPSMLTG